MDFSSPVISFKSDLPDDSKFFISDDLNGLFMAYLSSFLYEFIFSPFSPSDMEKMSFPESRDSSSVVEILSRSLRSPVALPYFPFKSFGVDLLDQSFLLWFLVCSVVVSAIVFGWSSSFWSSLLVSSFIDFSESEAGSSYFSV